MVGNPDHATKGPCDHATAGQNGPAVLLGIHAHNDSGLAVANSVEAFRAGARMVQGCVNGYGERAGNANLTTIVPALQLKLGAPVTTPEKLAGLRSLSLAVDDLVNQRPDARAPFVGEAAFSHKAGAHVSGVRRNPASFEHVPPESVGNERHVVLSELSGASNVLYRLKQAGSGAAEVSKEDVRKIVAELKARGYVDRGVVTKNLSAIKIAGTAWKSPHTYYTIRDKVVPGDKLNPARIENGMHVWMRK
jgi:isopropylmalate/homocitrate/citramalate synthase